MRVSAAVPEITRTHTPSAQRSHLREYLVAAGVFLALAVIFFNPIFRGFSFVDVAAHQNSIYPWHAYPGYLPDTYPQTDEADTFYPWQAFINDSLRSGSLPLWNPNSFGGQPFFANGQSGTLYPPRFVLSFLLPPDWVHDLLLFLHVVLSGLFMFALLKEYRAGFLGALFAGIAWMFSSYTLAWIQLETFAFLAVFLPAALWLTYRAARRGSWWSAVGAGAMLGFLALGGNVSFVLLVFVTCLLYGGILGLIGAAPLVRQRSWYPALRSLMLPGVIVAVALGIAAVQLLPINALLGKSGRAPFPYEVFRQQFLVARSTYLNTFRSPPIPISATSLNTDVTFVGLPTALFAVIGFLQRRPGAVFGRWLAIIVFLVSIGTPATWIAYHLIPGFGNFRPLGRGLFLWDFAITLLGGLGLDACIRWARAPRVGSPRGLSRRSYVHRGNALLRIYRQHILGAMVATATIAILLTTAQLFSYDRAANPPFQLRESQYLFPETPLISAIHQDKTQHASPEIQRIIPLTRSYINVPWSPPMLYASDAMLFGIQSIGGYDSLVPDRTVDLWRVVQGDTPQNVLANQLQSAYVTSFFPQNVRFDLLQRLGVTTIVTSPEVNQDPTWIPTRYAPLQLQRQYGGKDGQVYDISGASPRAYLVYNAEVVQTPLEALQRFTDPAFDYQHRLLLESPASPTSAGGNGAGSTNRSVSLTHYGTNDLALDVTASQPGWVVIADMWAPGWQASVNNQPSEVIRADYALRAVAVPAGASHIALRYRPTEFVVGAGVTTGTVSLIIIAAVAQYIVSRRRSRNVASRHLTPPLPERTKSGSAH